MKNLEEKKHEFIIFPRVIISLFILIIILVFPLIVISGSESFYKNRLEKSNCYSMISEKDCIDLSMNVLNYLKGKESLDSRYDGLEQSHFSDVKLVFDFLKALTLALFIFVAIYFMLFFMLDKIEIFKTLKLAGLMIISTLGLLLLMITLSFQNTFFLFHELFFPQGNWTFPFDSTIIIVFSEGFFVHAAFTSFIFSLGAGLMMLGVVYLKVKNETKNKI